MRRPKVLEPWASTRYGTLCKHPTRTVPRPPPVAKLFAKSQRERRLDRADLPRLLADLELVRATAIARFMGTDEQRRPDELLDVEQAAQRLGVSTDYLYRHHDEHRFTRREGRKLLFSAAGLDLYLKAR
jgi:excisionase family DNA binding protein